MSGKWESSGPTELTKECHGQLYWLHPKTVRIWDDTHMASMKIV